MNRAYEINDFCCISGDDLCANKAESYGPMLPYYLNWIPIQRKYIQDYAASFYFSCYFTLETFKKTDMTKLMNRLESTDVLLQKQLLQLPFDT